MKSNIPVDPSKFQQSHNKVHTPIDQARAPAELAKVERSAQEL
jgi:hypothetical protein